MGSSPYEYLADCLVQMSRQAENLIKPIRLGLRIQKILLKIFYEVLLPSCIKIPCPVINKITGSSIIIEIQTDASRKEDHGLPFVHCRVCFYSAISCCGEASRGVSDGLAVAVGAAAGIWITGGFVSCRVAAVSSQTCWVSATLPFSFWP